MRDFLLGKNKNKSANKKKIVGEKGFTLIEVLISISIFSIIIGTVILFSVRTIEAHTKSQAMQNAIENSRFAIETLNKKIRTSHQLSDDDGDSSQFESSSEIFFIDNVDGSRYCYKFLADKLVVDKVPDTSEALDCGHSDFNNFVDLAGTDDGKIIINGAFFVKQTNASNRKRGFVRTVIEVTYNNTGTMVAEKDNVKIQSGVSLRDY